MISNIYKHLFNREYMGGVDRGQSRIKSNGEFFTPTPLVEQILDNMDSKLFVDPEATFLDNSCGDGQFLASVLYRKLINGIDFETALSAVYGVDLMQDNVDECRKRLLCGRIDLQHIVERNIVCADALRYHYRFDSSNLYDKTPEEQFEEHVSNLFSFE